MCRHSYIWLTVSHFFQLYITTSGNLMPRKTHHCHNIAWLVKGFQSSFEPSTPFFQETTIDFLKTKIVAWSFSRIWVDRNSCFKFSNSLKCFSGSKMNWNCRGLFREQLWLGWVSFEKRIGWFSGGTFFLKNNGSYRGTHGFRCLGSEPLAVQRTIWA